MGTTEMGNAHLRSARKYIKLLIASALRYLGIFRLERLLLSRSRGCILAFHRVVEDGQITDLLDPQMYVTTPVFRDLLLFLRRQYDVVPLVNLINGDRAKGSWRKLFCALTFDDGYMDNYTNAFPILEEMKMPSTVFLTAGLVGTTQLLWTDAISIAFARVSESQDDKMQLGCLFRADGLLTPVFPYPKRAGDSFPARAVTEQLKTRPRARIEALLSRLQPYVTGNESEARKLRLLTWGQAREMMTAGVQFGAHTLSHCILPVEDRSTVRREIRESKALIESKLGTSIGTIAYPNGACDSETIHIARQAGFRMGVTLQKGYVSVRSDPMRMGRFLINQQDITSPAGRFCSSLFEYEKSVFVLHVKCFLRSLFRLNSEKRP